MSFFNQLGKTVSTAAQETTEKAKNYAEIARLNSSVADIEKQLAVSYEELGRMYYDRYRDNCEAEGQEKIEEITHLSQRVRELKDRVIQLKGLRLCPTCGAESTLSMAFCSSCGSKLPPLPIATECPRCHMPIQTGDRFCCGCGYAFPSVGAADVPEHV